MTKLLPPPVDYLPHDGRFGAGPSLVRPAQVDALSRARELGTSHRQSPVKDRVHSVQDGLRELFSLPSSYEIVLGLGGATAFWSMAATSLVDSHARAAVFGEFGAKCAADVGAAPWVSVEVTAAPAGELAMIEDDLPDADTYLYPHNETSTGVVSPLYRGAPTPALTLVDATSIAGAAPVDWDLVDGYYFSPQKCFGSEGGLWLSALSPAAIARAEEVTRRTDRFVPSFLNLTEAIKQSRAHQTLNTPAIATLILLDEQVKWMNQAGGIDVMARRSRAGADAIAQWASERPFASLFVQDPELRSPVVTTVDLDPRIAVDKVSGSLREVGIVDIEGYRKLGRNQLRIASFPSISPADIQALLRCLDWVIDQVPAR